MGLGPPTCGVHGVPGGKGVCLFGTIGVGIPRPLPLPLPGVILCLKAGALRGKMVHS